MLCIYTSIISFISESEDYLWGLNVHSNGTIIDDKDLKLYSPEVLAKKRLYNAQKKKWSAAEKAASKQCDGSVFSMPSVLEATGRPNKRTRTSTNDDQVQTPEPSNGLSLPSTSGKPSAARSKIIILTVNL